MTALDAQYHTHCLTALANTERTTTNAKSEFNKQEAIDGIEVGEIMICIICKRDQTDTDVNSTRIKKMLIKYARPNNYQIFVMCEMAIYFEINSLQKVQF